MKTEQEEYIICAAIHFDDGKYREHQPKNISSGIVVCGRRHHNCFTTVAALSKQTMKRLKRANTTQGFLTDKDNFVNRKEAGKIAFKASQIKNKTDCLFSEELY